MTNKKINKNVSTEINNYGDESITSLDFLTHMRQRSGMYGGSDPANHCVREVIDNSLDEIMNGYATKIDVIIDTNKNQATIIDNGRGIPTGCNSKGRPTIQRVFQDANTGGKFDGSKNFAVSSGLNGTGLKFVTAVSEMVHAESERDGKRVAIDFSMGKVTKEYREIKAIGNGAHGTLVSFIPDHKLFSKDNLYIIDPEKIKTECKMRALLNKGAEINLTIDNKKYSFFYPNGMIEYFNEELQNKLFNMEPIMFEYTSSEDNWYEVTFCYDAKSTNENIKSYSNGILNSSGTHETGFKESFTRVINNFIKDKDLLPKKNKNLKITGDDIRKGLNVVLNCRIKSPLYSSQVKDVISNSEVRTDMNTIINTQLSSYIEQNEILFKKICERIIKFASATENIKKMQDKIVKNTGNGSLSFSDKFINCSSKNADECELFIVEGKSARGPIRDGRNTKTQAVYSLRGKILNTLGANMAKLLSNNETEELMRIIFGTNNKKEINEKKEKCLRFKKIIACCDADDDGKLNLISITTK